MEFKNYFLVNGKDRKSIAQFSREIDILEINANISIQFKKSMKQNIENYNLKFLIDPMSYILQSDTKFLKNTEGVIRSSLKKVFNEVYCINVDGEEHVNKNKLLNIVKDNTEKMIEKVIEFQENYFNKDDVEKLGIFSKKQKKPEFLSCPYFIPEDKEFVRINKKIIDYFNEKYKDRKTMFRLLVLKETINENIEKTIKDLNNSNIKLIQIWVESSAKNRFDDLIKIFNQIKNKEIVFKFVSFKEIYKISQNKEFKEKVKGFITAFGYGESRNIFPVGGGIPVNKVYSLSKRKRIEALEFFNEIKNKKINLENNNDKQKYFDKICNCKICKELINQDKLESIYRYGANKKYEKKLKNGMRHSRLIATQDAITLTNYHYVANKIIEYEDFQKDKFNDSDWYKDFIDKQKNTF